VTAPREFVFVGREIRDEFWREWRAIEQRYPLFGEAPEGVTLAEHWAALSTLRAVARAELRAAIKQAARDSVEEDFNRIYPLAL
jgi:hypothetical protein